MTRDIFPSVYKFSRRVVARHKCNDCGVTSSRRAITVC